MDLPPNQPHPSAPPTNNPLPPMLGNNPTTQMMTDSSTVANNGDGYQQFFSAQPRSQINAFPPTISNPKVQMMAHAPGYQFYSQQPQPPPLEQPTLIMNPPSSEQLHQLFPRSHLYPYFASQQQPFYSGYSQPPAPPTTNLLPVPMMSAEQHTFHHRNEYPFIPAQQQPNSSSAPQMTASPRGPNHHAETWIILQPECASKLIALGFTQAGRSEAVLPYDFVVSRKKSRGSATNGEQGSESVAQVNDRLLRTRAASDASIPVSDLVTVGLKLHTDINTTSRKIQQTQYCENWLTTCAMVTQQCLTASVVPPKWAADGSTRFPSFDKVIPFLGSWQILPDGETLLLANCVLYALSHTFLSKTSQNILETSLNRIFNIHFDKNLPGADGRKLAKQTQTFVKKHASQQWSELKKRVTGPLCLKSPSRLQNRTLVLSKHERLSTLLLPNPKDGHIDEDYADFGIELCPKFLKKYIEDTKEAHKGNLNRNNISTDLVETNNNEKAENESVSSDDDEINNFLKILREERGTLGARSVDTLLAPIVAPAITALSTNNNANNDMAGDAQTPSVIATPASAPTTTFRWQGATSANGLVPHSLESTSVIVGCPKAPASTPSQANAPATIPSRANAAAAQHVCVVGSQQAPNSALPVVALPATVGGLKEVPNTSAIPPQVDPAVAPPVVRLKAPASIPPRADAAVDLPVTAGGSQATARPEVIAEPESVVAARTPAAAHYAPPVVALPATVGCPKEVPNTSAIPPQVDPAVAPLVIVVGLKAPASIPPRADAAVALPVTAGGSQATARPEVIAEPESVAAARAPAAEQQMKATAHSKRTKRGCTHADFDLTSYETIEYWTYTWNDDKAPKPCNICKRMQRARMPRFGHACWQCQAYFVCSDCWELKVSQQPSSTRQRKQKKPYVG